MQAQSAVQTVPDNPAPYTLHLYARLVEIPTIIFFPRGRRPPVLDPKLVNIQLNADKPFHPASLRLEGEDPLSIAMLFDVSGDDKNFLSDFQKDFAGWASKSLHTQDRVSIYTLDCNLMQTANSAPIHPDSLQASLNLALTSPLAHGASGKPSCAKSIRLRGSIVLIMRKLSERPGRHILLVVSSGRDGKSELSWSQINAEAGIDSVTVFALTPEPEYLEDVKDLYNLTRQSGGFIFSPTPTLLPKTLEQVISLLRSRYILQFPMPESLTPVVYHVIVTLPKFNATTFTSGISVPLPNPAVDHPATDLPTDVPGAVPTPPPPPELVGPSPPPAAATPNR